MKIESEILTAKAKQNLERNAEFIQKDSNFVKIHGENILKFNPDKIDQIQRDFNGKKIRRYQYTVTEPTISEKLKIRLLI